MNIDDAIAIRDRLRKDPTPLVVLPESPANNGRLLLRIDGLTTYLHRWLYQELIGHLEPGEILHLDPKYPTGDQNPYHWYISRRRTIACVNGHPYPLDQPTGGCRICRAGRRERFSTGGLPAWALRALVTHCPQGHPYSEENTRVFMDSRGYRHRACRACQKERS